MHPERFGVFAIISLHTPNAWLPALRPGDAVISARQYQPHHVNDLIESIRTRYPVELLPSPVATPGLIFVLGAVPASDHLIQPQAENKS